MKKTFYERAKNLESEARKEICRLQEKDIDWKEFDDTVCIYDHFTGDPVNFMIDGVKDGVLLISEKYVCEAGEEVSLNDTDPVSIFSIADFMINSAKDQKKK